jgi:hypothetical protein
MAWDALGWFKILDVRVLCAPDRRSASYINPLGHDAFMRFM